MAARTRSCCNLDGLAEWPRPGSGTGSDSDPWASPRGAMGGRRGLMPGPVYMPGGGPGSASDPWASPRGAMGGRREITPGPGSSVTAALRLCAASWRPGSASDPWASPGGAMGGRRGLMPGPGCARAFVLTAPISVSAAVAAVSTPTRRSVPVPASTPACAAVPVPVGVAGSTLTDESQWSHISGVRRS